MIIRGRFDPFEWAADPDRRNDIYDATAPVPAATSNTITGFAGAAGRVEGVVRVLDGPEQGDQLQPGEILVAVTTNVGWTPLFPARRRRRHRRGRAAFARGHRRPRVGHPGRRRLRQRHDAPAHRRPGAGGRRQGHRRNIVKGQRC